MDYEFYQAALLSEPFDEHRVECILDEYFHAGEPHVFHGNAAAHGQFMRGVASEISSAFALRCHPRHVVICGSAHLGFSASPKKLGKTFSPTDSDIDVAVLLPELFDRWWLELVEPRVVLGNRRIIAGHLLNGYINPQLVRDSTTIGREWWRIFGTSTATGFKKVRGRIYRDPQFMQNYHRLSVIRGRETLRGARA
jgi:hypothetical protein